MSDTIKSVSNVNLAAFAEALAAKVPLKSDLPTKVSDLANDTGFTTNEGTITSVTLNGTTTSSGDVNLGYLVVQEGGKGLSSNDYTSLEKSKLEGIESGAQVNTIESISVNETTITPVNKAVDITVPTMLSDLSDDSTHRVVTDTEKSTWSGKQDALTFDSAPTENSSNPVTSGGIYQTIVNNEFVVSTALNDLNTRVSDLEEVEVPTKTSDLTNDSGFLTSHQDISGKANVADLATVATSGSYNDLSDKPTIPAGVVVDQTFDATSSNSQSGVAIASALSGKQDTISDLAIIRSGAGLGATAYQKPSTGIPASDLASGVIPDISGKENTSNKVTSLSAQSTDTQYPSAKATYDAIYPSVQTTQPQGGMLPNVFYNLGLLSANTTFSLATPVDANILNHYYWVFETGSTNITITWPSAITSWIDTPPVISANKHYEISVLNGVGGYIEV